jgi:UDPglucose 6-dehydrogenase
LSQWIGRLLVDNEATLEQAEALVLLVGHRQFRQLRPGDAARLTPGRIIIDTVNGWDPGAWRAAGFQVYRLGDNK